MHFIVFIQTITYFPSSSNLTSFKQHTTWIINTMNFIFYVNFIVLTLTYLSLHSQSLTSISFIQTMPLLRTLILTNNQITNLQPLSKLTQLTDIYLSFNPISFVELKRLSKLCMLRVIWLVGCQISYSKEYRVAVCGIIKSLRVIDDTAITKNEKEASWCERLSCSSLFKLNKKC